MDVPRERQARAQVRGRRAEAAEPPTPVGAPLKADIEEVPKEVRDELEFVFVSRLDEALAAALEHMPQPSQAYVDEMAAKAAASPVSTN